MKIYFGILLIFISLTVNAQIAFEEHIVISESTIADDPLQVINGDINGDGSNDLVVVSRGDSTLGWYKNLDGLGTFSTRKNIAEVINVTEVAARDIDGDGDLDLIVTRDLISITEWYENLDGQGNFGPGIFIGSVSGSRTLEVADLDGDSDLDILIAGQESLEWSENLDGQGSFGTPQGLAGNSTITSIQATDLDGDGDLDVTYTTSNIGTFSWIENIDGLGTFEFQQTIGTMDAEAIYAIDIDNDLDQDIIAVGDEVFWFENTDGSGTFGPRITIDPRPTTSMDMADINGDGFQDLITGTSEFNNSDVFWYEHLDGNGNFGPAQITPIGANLLSSVMAADLDGDGDIDLASTGTFLDAIYWVINLDGNGDFGNGLNSFSINQTVDKVKSVGAADLDGDDDLDVVAISETGNRFLWFENVDGQGGTGVQRTLPSNATGINSLFPADIDGDSDIDLVYCTDGGPISGQLGWFENTDGSGDFANITINPTAGELLSASSADIDGDNDNDIIVLRGNFIGQPTNIQWYENSDGQGNFNPSQSIANSVSSTISRNAIAVDFDGDLDIDIVHGRYWFENNGAGIFVENNIIAPVGGTTDSRTYIDFVTDVDGDGFLDIFYIVMDELFWAKHLDGQGNFSPGESIAVIDQQTNIMKRIVAEDFDSDGDIDVAVSSVISKVITWFENIDGLGTFGVAQPLADSVDQVENIVLGDMNSDGRIDVLSASYNDDKVAWFENLGTNANEINGTIRLDLDSNGCTSSDNPITSIKITADDGTNTYSTFTNSNGFYQLFVPEGSFTTYLENVSNYFDVTPNTFSNVFVGIGNTDTDNFCIEPNQNVDDVNISLYPLNDAIPGFTAKYQLVYNNVGVSALSGDVTLNFDEIKLAFNLASQTVDQQTANSLTFNYNDLQPFETRTIDIWFNVAPPPTTNSGDILIFESVIEPISGDNTPDDNEFTFEQIVINSFDPNDIVVSEGEEIFLNEVGNYLHYMIRFQNLGTAPAFNVRVLNELEQNFDWSTLQMESSSHNFYPQISNGNIVEFFFDGINLPPASTNEEESHGYISYKIKPLNSLGVGDAVTNDAEIYFDFNLPIFTNTVTTTVIENLSVEENPLQHLKIHPNPTTGIVNISASFPVIFIKVLNSLGQEILTISDSSGIDQFSMKSFPRGLYFIQIDSQDGIGVVRKVLRK